MPSKIYTHSRERGTPPRGHRGHVPGSRSALTVPQGPRSGHPLPLLRGWDRIGLLILLWPKIMTVFSNLDGVARLLLFILERNVSTLKGPY